jgi:hypothetical protein
MPDHLSIVADNPTLLSELRTLLEKHFMTDDRTDDAISDTQLGQVYRARLVGLKKIEAAFKEISTHKTRKEIARTVNRAR